MGDQRAAGWPGLTLSASQPCCPSLKHACRGGRAYMSLKPFVHVGHTGPTRQSGRLCQSGRILSQRSDQFLQLSAQVAYCVPRRKGAVAQRNADSGGVDSSLKDPRVLRRKGGGLFPRPSAFPERLGTGVISSCVDSLPCGKVFKNKNDLKRMSMFDVPFGTRCSRGDGAGLGPGAASLTSVIVIHRLVLGRGSFQQP